MNKVLNGLDAFIEYATATRKFADVGFYEEVKKALLQQTEQLNEAKTLLDVANCPQCGDKSGAYYDNDGEVCQCQWCYEVSKLYES